MTNDKKRSAFITLSFAEIIFSALTCICYASMHFDFPPFSVIPSVLNILYMTSMALAFVLICIIFALNMRYRLIPLKIMSVAFAVQILFPFVIIFIYDGFILHAVTIAVQIILLIALIKMIKSGTEISESAQLKNVNDKKDFSLAVYLIQAVPASIAVLSLFETYWEELISPNQFSPLYNFYHTIGYNFKDQTLLHGILRKTDFYLGGQWDSARLELCMFISFICILVLIFATKNSVFSVKEKALLLSPYLLPVAAVILYAAATPADVIPPDGNPVIDLIFAVVICACALFMAAVQIFILCRIIKLFKKHKSNKSLPA